MRGFVFGSAVLSGFVVALAACGPPPKKAVSKKDDVVTDPDAMIDKGVDVKKARALLDRAEEALKNKDIAAVRRLAEQADPYANDAIRDDILQLRQRADQSVANDLAPDLIEAAKSGQCQKTAERVVQIGEENKGTAVITFVKNAVSKPLLGCLLKALDIDQSVARDLAAVPAFKKALNADDFELWDSKLDDATTQMLSATLSAPVIAKDWPAALKELDAMVARKEAGPAEVVRVMRVIRNNLAEQIEQKVKGAVGTKLGAAGALKDVDALIGYGRWTQDDPVPSQIDKRRTDLAFWVACASVDCTMTPTQPVWAYGDVDVKPLLEPNGKPVARVKHAQPLWRVAEGKGAVLVADHDPGTLDGVEARVPVAAGWVSAFGVSNSDTAERVPPGDAIVGVRLWGPFREKVNEWELGIARAAKGDDITVERISDGKSVKARRGEVRFGAVKPGLKVLALCDKVKETPAKVDEVVPISGAEAHVKLTCLDDKGNPSPLKREVLLGSLRTDAGWLPPRQ